MENDKDCDTDSDTKDDLIKIRENIKCLINGCNKGNSYFDYEMNMFIFFVDKYSDIIYEYSEEIFLAYVKYFENLYKLCSKNTLISDNNNYYFYLKNLHSRLASEEKINNLFSLLFKNKKNIIDKTNIAFFSFAISGHDIIKCYICLGGKFDEIETKIMMNSIAENPILDLGNSLISIFNDNDVFFYNNYLLEYASYIGINNYIKRYIKKNQNICSVSKKCLHDILMFSNDLDLCNILIDFYDNDCLEFACKSQNANIIILLLNNKMIPDKKLFELLLKYENESNKINEQLSFKLKIFEIDNENEYFLYSEFDKFNIHRNSLLIRKIKKEQYYSIQEIVTLFEKYRYNYTNDDYLLSINNKILISSNNFDNQNEIYIREFLDLCSKNSFYPFFQDKMYPKPDKKCLYIECSKKNNIKIIKKLTENLVDPDIKCLEIACGVNNNIGVIKYFIEKKNILPDIECIKINLKLCCGLEDFDKDFKDLKNINNLILFYGNHITKYLYQKYISNK
jgi:hypothetical protein